MKKTTTLFLGLIFLVGTIAALWHFEILKGSPSASSTLDNELDDIKTPRATGCGGAITLGCSGAGCLLDPDGDGDIVLTSTNFTDCNLIAAGDEMYEFETLTNPLGCASCQVGWTPITSLGETSNDLWAGGAGCNNVDIIGDGQPSNHWGYYSIIDPDGNCNTGDEMLVVRIRGAEAVSGSFSFSVLVDTDMALGSADPDGVQCAQKISNIGFEYEIIANPGPNKKVKVNDVNGVVGSFNSTVVEYDNDTHYNQAGGCRSECGCDNGSVYHTLAVKLSDFGKDCNDQNFRIFVGTASQGSGTVSFASSIADYGGVSETDCGASVDPCGCCVECADANSQFYCAGDFDQCIDACQQNCGATGQKSTMPIELTSFTGKMQDKEVLLEWLVASETNNDRYEIERSANGVDFEMIGEEAGQGTTTEEQHYSFLDLSPQSGHNYYRLKQIDKDGTTSYTHTIVVSFEALVGEIKVYPTEVNNDITIELELNQDRDMTVIVSDINGRQALTQNISLSSGRNQQQVDLSNLQTGMYVLTLRDGTFQRAFKIVKK